MVNYSRYFLKTKSTQLNIDTMGKKFTTIDLFAGAGGLTEGFKMAGFETIAANEIVPTYSETYKLNNPNVKIFTEDIRNITVEQFKKECKINGKKVDVLIGGPPCQGFSMAGMRDPKDPRNSLFMDFIRFVDGLKPTFFVMENVPGILTMKTAKGEKVIDLICKEYERIGYKFKYKKLHAADYGVPQKRKRVIFIGTNTNKDINYPKPTHDKEAYKTIEGKQIKKWVGAETILLPKNKVPKNFFLSEKMINGFIKRREQNKKKGRGFGWQIIDPKTPCYTISARYWKDGSDALVKYSDKEIRMLTPKEAAAIQTFPQNFKFFGSKRDVYTQIGNAVPVLLAKAIAEEIKKSLD